MNRHMISQLHLLSRKWYSVETLALPTSSIDFFEPDIVRVRP